jgi:hypothetical protein
MLFVVVDVFRNLCRDSGFVVLHGHRSRKSGFS